MRIAEEIVNGFIAGSKEAFHELYELTSQELYALIYRMTGNQQDAEDLLHDVYVRIYEKRRQFDPRRSAVYTWMYRVAVNYTLNDLRQKKRWQKDVVMEEISIVNHDHADMALQVQELLQKINPDFRTCLVLHEIEQLAYEEIAGILNISIGTVRSRINRAKVQLKKICKEQEVEL